MERHPYSEVPPCAQTFLGYGNKLDCVVTKGFTKIRETGEEEWFLQLSRKQSFAVSGYQSHEYDAIIK